MQLPVRAADAQDQYKKTHTGQRSEEVLSGRGQCKEGEVQQNSKDCVEGRVVMVG